MMLGRAVKLGYDVMMPKTVFNKSILFVGQSGSGKTVALQKVEREIAQGGGQVVVLNYNGTHDKFWGGETDLVQRIDITRQGLPFSLLTPLVYPNGELEKDFDVIEAIVTAFSVTGHLQVRQKSVLRKAVEAAIHNEEVEDEIQAICDGIRIQSGLVADSVYDHFIGLLHKLKSSRKNTFGILAGKITILDFGLVDEMTERTIVELVLAVLWRYFRIYGQGVEHPLYVVLDEFQNLNLGKNSILKEIVCQGRKFNYCVLLATQSLSGYDVGTWAILQQLATMLQFHPVTADLHRLMKRVSSQDRESFKCSLETLKKGECIGFGRFLIGGIEIEKPIKISFVEEDL